MANYYAAARSNAFGVRDEERFVARGAELSGAYGEAAAFELHQRFKEEFVATVDREGGIIEGALIHQWIFERVVAAGGRIILPSGGRLLSQAEGRA